MGRAKLKHGVLAPRSVLCPLSNAALNPFTWASVHPSVQIMGAQYLKSTRGQGQTGSLILARPAVSKADVAGTGDQLPGH